MLFLSRVFGATGRPDRLVAFIRSSCIDRRSRVDRRAEEFVDAAARMSFALLRCPSPTTSSCVPFAFPAGSDPLTLRKQPFMSQDSKPV